MDNTSIFATDFDGTLLRSDGSFSEIDISALTALGRQGCSVVLASGRNPFSLKRCLGERTLPVDWYVLSSGAVILNSEGTVEVSHALSAGDTAEIHKALSNLGIEDFSIQGSFPDSHILHWMEGEHCTDFLRRLEFYRDFSREVFSSEMPSSEVIAFVQPDIADAVISALQEETGNKYSIVRATSPIDHYTVWIEVFPHGVNKASACEYIRNHEKVQPNRTAAVGNDWNDIHMLRWAKRSFAVANSPDELLFEFENVPSNDNCAVAAAAQIWLECIS
jgi:Cof subfamily protein (haloacid dehalogenase superfamily)